ncbi:MAG TPA: hypothetical protein VIO60_02870 [Rectinemataceae bacterium]
MRFVHGLNLCAPPFLADKGLRIYDSELKVPFAAYIHDGGHEVPDGLVARIVDFFIGIGAGKLSHLL